MPDPAVPVVAVLATLDSKSREAMRACDALHAAGVRPRVLDLSLRPHQLTEGDIPATSVAAAGGSDWQALASVGRGEAAEIMMSGGRAILSAEVDSGHVHGALGLGGANGTAIACGVMRELPLLFPKLMVSAVAATAAVQWYVGASDIVMFPSVGDLSLNRITGGVIDSAARSAAALATAWLARGTGGDEPPLVGVSSFGGTSGCVDRVEQRLREAGFEVILFHASGPGGRALERLAGTGELVGVVDVTTHELADLVVGGVYSAGDGRLRSAGRSGLPQVVVPGALDHSNFWVDQVPEWFRNREFFRYNAQNVLMRTNAAEYELLGGLLAERINDSRGPVAVLIPTRGFSEHTTHETFDLEGNPIGSWNQPEVDARLAEILRPSLGGARLEELDLHINDPAFADACADAFLEMVGVRTPVADARVHP